MKFSDTAVNVEKIIVAGKKLSAMSKRANEQGEFRIKADLKNRADGHGLVREHRAHIEARAEAIDFVHNTGKASLGIVEKYKCVDIQRSGGIRN